jgi:hypothetical protein
LILISDSKIRQIQVPIISARRGLFVIAMSLEGASIVLQNLSEIITIIAYPLILIILFSSLDLLREA